MKYKVLTMGYKDPNPEKIKQLLDFEASYIKREYPEKLQSNILIFSYVILSETAEINADTIEKARKNRIEYNLNPADLETSYDNHSIKNFVIEV